MEQKIKTEYEAMWLKYVDRLPERARREYGALSWRFLNWLGDRPLDEKSVLRYLKHLQEQQYAPGSVKKIFSVLRRFAKVNELSWVFRRDEIPTVQEADDQNYALPLEDVQMMVNVCRGLQAPLADIQVQPYHTAFLCLSTVWWMRAIEMRLMTSEDINFEDKMIYIRTRHGGRERFHRIPDFVIPYLEGWDFDTRITPFGMSRIFMDLREMIDFKVYGVGWHSIRRAAVREADRIGMTLAQKNIYARWTIGASQQAIRYSMAKTVSRTGSIAAAGFEDEEVDQIVYSKHPFVQMWK
ncbi:MAG: hypothetical protein QUS09_09115 [Methanotrichaceae archaeon]|nr:hypothetical protein [Methanotrichaceae archaeon]